MDAADPLGDGRIFICYRHTDSYAVLLMGRHLRSHFGEKRVFHDIGSMVSGDNIDEVIMEAIGSCAVLLAVVGHLWLIEVGDHGQRRLDDPGDYVRREIEAALRSGVRVIPVLLDGTRMPRADELPPSLRDLATRRAHEISRTTFDADIVKLLQAIDGVLAASADPQQDPNPPGADRSNRPDPPPDPPDSPKQPPTPPQPGPRRRLRPILLGATAALVLAAGITVTAIYLTAHRPRGHPRAAGPNNDTTQQSGGAKLPSIGPQTSPSPTPTPSTSKPPNVVRHRSGCNPINVANTPISGLIGVFAVKSYIPESVAFDPGGKIIAVATATNRQAGRTYLWNPVARTAVLLHDPGSKGAESVAFSPTGNAVAVGDGNGGTYLWNSATCGISAGHQNTKHRGVQAVAFSPLGARIAIGDNLGNAYLWNPSARTTSPLDDAGGFDTRAIAFNRTDTLLAIGDYDDSIYLWNPRTGAAIRQLTDVDGASVLGVAINQQSTRLAAADSIGTLYLWNLVSYKLAHRIDDPNSAAVQAVAFNPRGTAVAIGDSNGWTYIFSLASGKVVGQFHVRAEDFGVSSVAFSPDGTELAVADHNGTTYLWAVPTSAR